MLKQFSNSLSHIIAELTRINILLTTAVEHAQRGANDQLYDQNSFISTTEISKITTQLLSLPAWAINNQQSELPQAIASSRIELDQVIAATQQGGVKLRLADCRQLFKLSPLEMDIILLCLATEIDINYQKVFSYLQDDLTKRHPSVDLLLNLLSRTLPEKIALRNLFNETAPLRNYQLVQLVRDPHDNSQGLLSRLVMLDSHLVSYLLEQDNKGKNFDTIIEHVQIEQDFASLILPDELHQRLQAFNQLTQPFCLYLQAPAGYGKRSIATALCRQRRQALLRIDTQVLLNNKAEFSSRLQFIFREALLNQAVLYFEDTDLLFIPENKQQRMIVERGFDSHNGIIILAGQTNWRAQMKFTAKPFFNLSIPKPTTSDRVSLWKCAKQQLLSESSAIDTTTLAERFQLSPQQIFAATRTIRDLCLLEQTTYHTPSMADLFKICRSQAHNNLAALAQPVTPTYSLANIVLPVDCMQQLHDIIHYVERYAFVYEELGFAKKLAMGKGLNVLFVGPPGTGKTMAAEIIAATLELELYKIDLSTVVSKYIGETEKNLDKIFNAAESSNVILFFDEADALFSKRTEISDARDRHANAETSYLLQRIEAYQGIVILASNFKRNIDEAFLRRLHFCIDFPFPSSKERLRIWQHIWPDKIQLAQNINLAKLAEHLELTGGNIRNIALSAAFQATKGLVRNDIITITMEHIIYSVLRELKKIGRVINSAELQAKLR